MIPTLNIIAWSHAAPWARETTACDPPLNIPHAVDNPWFSGRAEITTYLREEMLATKLCALMQRNKGCDLFDPWARTEEMVERFRLPPECLR